MTAILANPATPLILAALIAPAAIWSGWTAIRMTLHAPAGVDPEETTP
jgi:hypothetical protein